MLRMKKEELHLLLLLLFLFQASQIHVVGRSKEQYLVHYFMFASLREREREGRAVITGRLTR